MPALIFDCDGVLADTERDGHRVAFNRAFEATGLPLHWDEPTYGELLAIGGGKERLRAALAQDGAPRVPDPDETVQQVHREKTRIYTELIDRGAVPARPGVRRIAAEADAAGWLLAVASTSARPSVEAVLRHVMGDELAGRFSVFAGDVVPRKKPAPDIYTLAVSELGVSTDEAVVVEDSGIGVAAARAAGLPVVVTVSSYTADEDFTGAAFVVSSLGDPGEPIRVLSDDAGIDPGRQITLADLSRVVANGRRNG